jgi:hypothetical protein
MTLRPPIDAARSRPVGVMLMACIPIVGLFLSAVSWLRYGIDFPHMDDFRAYDLGIALSLKPADLFTSANDTLYPVGKALDVLAQVYFRGNPVPYQLVSMLALLGGLLFLQWHLLNAALNDALVASACFLLTVFMLQPGTYWGIQNLAYHQGLPTLFLLGVIAVTVHDTWRRRWRVPAVFILGLLAGFSYISGAFAALSVAIVLIVLARTAKPAPPALFASGLALLAAASIAVAAQSYVILGAQGGHIHDLRAAWALPTEASFWTYLIGKVARSLALSIDAAQFAFAVAVMFLALAIGLGLLLTKRWLGNTLRSVTASKATIVFNAVLALVLTYLVLLAAGRANFQPGGALTAYENFFSSYYAHYHFFWVTLLIPWTVAAGFVALDPDRRSGAARKITVGGAVAIAGLAIASGGVFGHPSFYRGIEQQRVSSDLPCFRAAIETSGPIMCPGLYPYDLRPAFANARLIGASFTRFFDLKPVPLGSTYPPPLFRLSEQTLGRLQLVNVSAPEALQDGFRFTPSNNDPMFVLELPPEEMRACRELEMTSVISTTEPQIAEWYTVPTGQDGFMSPSSAHAAVGQGQSPVTQFTLVAHSSKGFESQVRLDPVMSDRPFTLSALEIRCRL